MSTFSPLAPWSGLSIVAIELAVGRLADVHDDPQAQPGPDLSFPSQTCSGPTIFGIGVGVFVC